MKPKFEKPMMARGVVVVGDKYEGMVSKDNEACSFARTLWYRHDDEEGLKELTKQMESIARVLMGVTKASGASMWYEYKEYKS